MVVSVDVLGAWLLSGRSVCTGWFASTSSLPMLCVAPKLMPWLFKRFFIRLYQQHCDKLQFASSRMVGLQDPLSNLRFLADLSLQHRYATAAPTCAAFLGIQHCSSFVESKVSYSTYPFCLLRHLTPRLRSVTKWLVLIVPPFLKLRMEGCGTLLLRSICIRSPCALAQPSSVRFTDRV